ncbi:ABC transporter permease [Candidatus Micrarchaeota archaeon]|nr:ABC transporter permease [Candidatus Micrarchaeota archaeon]
MNFFDLFNYSFVHLKHRGLRTWLTLLGIVVGISAVVVLVGIADGLKHSVSEELEMFGPDLLIITSISTSSDLTVPSQFRSTVGKLFEKDAQVISRVEGVDTVSNTITTSAVMKYKDEEVGGSIYGVELDNYLDAMVTLELEEGRFLEPGDRKAVLLGAKAATDTFDDPLDVNSVFEISGEKFRVVGILTETGSSYSNMDSIMVLPIEDARRIAGNTIANRELSAIRVKVAEGYDPVEVEDNIEWMLMQHRKVTEDEKDFGIVSARFIQEQVDSILGALTLFLSIVSGISLVVGAIGISNTMFMSVLERTREIGVLKSLGATSNQIQDLFLMESALIGLSGGIGGMVIGGLLLQVISLLGFDAVISVEVTVFAFAFSVAIGVFAGSFPAKEASLKPAIEALRYE